MVTQGEKTVSRPCLKGSLSDPGLLLRRPGPIRAAVPAVTCLRGAKGESTLRHGRRPRARPAFARA
jgi:hypothetical protein